MEPEERAQMLTIALLRDHADAPLNGSARGIATDLAYRWPEVVMQMERSRAVRQHLLDLSQERRPLLFADRRWRVEGPPGALSLELEDFVSRGVTYPMPLGVAVCAELPDECLTERGNKLITKRSVVADLLCLVEELSDLWSVDREEPPLTVLSVRPLAMFTRHR